jgi:hypothetical protein
MWSLKSDFAFRHPSDFFRPHHAGANAYCKSSRSRAAAIDKEGAAALKILICIDRSSYRRTFAATPLLLRLRYRCGRRTTPIGACSRPLCRAILPIRQLPRQLELWYKA